MPVTRLADDARVGTGSRRRRSARRRTGRPCSSPLLPRPRRRQRRAGRRHAPTSSPRARRRRRTWPAGPWHRRCRGRTSTSPPAVDSIRTGMLPGTVSMCPSRTSVRRASAASDLADRVARLVDERAIVAGGLHLGDQPARRRLPSSRESERMATRPRTRSTAAARSITRSGRAAWRRSRRTPMFDLVVADDERRQQSKHRRSCRQGDHAVLEHQRLQHRRHLGSQLDREHQPEPRMSRTIATPSSRARRALEHRRAELCAVLDQPLAAIRLQSREAGGAGERRSAKRAAVRALMTARRGSPAV